MTSLYNVRLAVFCLLMLLATSGVAQQTYEVKNARVRFYTEAPSELISAYSTRLKGNIDLRQQVFHFSLPVATFRGFNCALLRLHFNASCMETVAHPLASFSGVLLDEVDWSRPGSYSIRAKGKLRIHGVEQYRILRVRVENDKGHLSFDTQFPVVFDEFNIRVPRALVRSVPSEVMVSVSGTIAAAQARYSLK